MRRLFSIWNRGYKTQLVIAQSAPEALQISVDSGHIRRTNMYRRFADLTDEVLAQDDKLLPALEAGKSGVATNVEEDGWAIDGEIVS